MKEQKINDLIKEINDFQSSGSLSDELKLEEKLIKLFRLLYPNISDIVNFYMNHKKFFYRGFSGEKIHDDIFIYSPRQDRKPKDTSIKTHEFFNKAFNLFTGGKVNRSNAMFAIADYSEAENYGRVFVVFPFNGFDYLFSKKIDDLYEFYRKYYEKFYSKKKYSNKYIISFIRNVNIKIYLVKNNSSINDLYNELVAFYKLKYKSRAEKIKNQEKNLLSLDEKHEIINDIIRDIDKSKHWKFLEELLAKYTIKLIDEPKHFNEFIKIVQKQYNFNKNLEQAISGKPVEVMFRADRVLCVHHFLINRGILERIVKKIRG